MCEGVWIFSRSVRRAAEKPPPVCGRLWGERQASCTRVSRRCSDWRWRRPASGAEPACPARETSIIQSAALSTATHTHTPSLYMNTHSTDALMENTLYTNEHTYTLHKHTPHMLHKTHTHTHSTKTHTNTQDWPMRLHTFFTAFLFLLVILSHLNTHKNSHPQSILTLFLMKKSYSPHKSHCEIWKDHHLRPPWSQEIFCGLLELQSPIIPLRAPGLSRRFASFTSKVCLVRISRSGMCCITCV